MADQNRTQLAEGDKQLCRGVVISLSYIKSILGIAKIGGMVFSMITFICVAATQSIGVCYHAPSGAYNFVEFVSMTTFWCCLVMFVAFLFKLNVKIPFIAWNLTELIWVGIDAIFFLVAFIMIAVYTCGAEGYQAAAAFSCLSLVCLVVNLVMVILKFRQEIKDRKRGPPADSTVTTVDTMHDF